MGEGRGEGEGKGEGETSLRFRLIFGKVGIVIAFTTDTLINRVFGSFPAYFPWKTQKGVSNGNK